MDNQPSTGRDRRKPLHMADKQTQGHLLWLLVLIALAILAVFVLVLASGGHQGMAGFMRLLLSLLVATIVIVIVVVYAGLRWSNRIAGPFVNFGRNLQMIQRGDYTSTVRLRHGDEFQNMAGVFNQALEALRARAHEDIEFLDKLSAEIAKMDGPGKAEAVRAIQDRRSAKERHITKSQIEA
jgi:methyl-accepting chemotaxis protein